MTAVIEDSRAGPSHVKSNDGPVFITGHANDQITSCRQAAHSGPLLPILQLSGLCAPRLNGMPLPEPGMWLLQRFVPDRLGLYNNMFWARWQLHAQGVRG
jgi:hypothetical protein